jgi:hypothetical protein
VKEHKLTLRLSPGEHAELREQAAERGCSMSELVRQKLFAGTRTPLSSYEQRLQKLEERLDAVEHWQIEADLSK